MSETIHVRPHANDNASSWPYRVVEIAKCEKCNYTYENGKSVCLRDGGPEFCAWRWTVVDVSLPKTEECSYGLAAYGFDCREEAQKYANECNKTGWH